MLYAHPKVLSDPARIRFTEFGDCSLNLDVFAYVDVTNYGAFLEIAEDLNLRIMDIVTASGSRLAIPSQELYVQRGRSMDEDKTRASENTVREWRNQNTLFLPRFPDEKIEELQGTLDFPPHGSPDAVGRS